MRSLALVGGYSRLKRTVEPEELNLKALRSWSLPLKDLTRDSCSACFWYIIDRLVPESPTSLSE